MKKQRLIIPNENCETRGAKSFAIFLSKVIWIRSGWLRGSIYWVLLVLGSVCGYKTIIPEAQEYFLVSSGPRYTPSFGGLGLRQMSSCITTVGKLLSY